MTTSIPEVKPHERFTPTQAAKVLGIAVRSVYYAMTKGELPFTMSQSKQRRYISGVAIRRYYLSH